MARKRTTKKKTSMKGNIQAKKRSTQARKGKTQARQRAWIGWAVLAVVILVAGLVYAFTRPPSVVLEISVDEAFQQYPDDAFFLDVRETIEWDEYHIPGTTLIPLGELATRVNEVPRDKPIVVVCRSGNRSQEGRDILLNAGFEDVVSMAGGVNTWRSLGYPIEP